MKKISILFLLLTLAISFSGCRKLLQFHIQYQSTCVIPSSMGINLPFDLPTPDQASRSEQEFEANDTRKDLVEYILLNGLDMEISSPAGKTFSFLKSVEISIQGKDLSPTVIAFENNVPQNIGNTLSLNTTQNNIADHIKAATFKLIVTVVTDETLFQDVTIAVNSDFFVQAKSLL